jgi:hypothetical protein
MESVHGHSSVIFYPYLAHLGCVVHRQHAGADHIHAAGDQEVVKTNSKIPAKLLTCVGVHHRLYHSLQQGHHDVTLASHQVICVPPPSQWSRAHRHVGIWGYGGCSDGDLR